MPRVGLPVRDEGRRLTLEFGLVSERLEEGLDDRADDSS